MTDFLKTYLPSARSGLTWQLYVYKPQGRPAYATANEGRYEVADGVTFFTSTLHLDRVRHPATRVDIQGPATAKKKAAALEQLKQQLLEAGLIAADALTPA